MLFLLVKKKILKEKLSPVTVILNGDHDTHVRLDYVEHFARS